jgi:hypothetical protein
MRPEDVPTGTILWLRPEGQYINIVALVTDNDHRVVILSSASPSYPFGSYLPSSIEVYSPTAERPFLKGCYTIVYTPERAHA